MCVQRGCVQRGGGVQTVCVQRGAIGLAQRKYNDSQELIDWCAVANNNTIAKKHVRAKATKFSLV